MQLHLAPRQFPELEESHLPTLPRLRELGSEFQQMVRLTPASLLLMCCGPAGPSATVWATAIRFDVEEIPMTLTVYLAGEIHTSWREELIEKVKEKGLDLEFVFPQQVHERSDNVGEDIQGTQPNNYFRDLAASDINNFRTEVLLNKADIVIALFGEQYRQWNTAMDLSTGLALGKPSIMIRPESLIHPLKELSRKTNVTVETVEQAAEVLAYVFE